MMQGIQGIVAKSSFTSPYLLSNRTASDLAVELRSPQTVILVPAPTLKPAPHVSFRRPTINY